MGSDIIKLRRVRSGEWALYAPAGHQLSSIFRGTQMLAMEWARAYCSTWGNWALQLDGEDEYGKADRFPSKDVQGS